MIIAYTRWTLVSLLCVLLFPSVTEGQDGERHFRREVRAAIDRGRGYLVRSLTRKRKRANTQFESAYPMGYRSLIAYALLEAGTAPDSAEIVELFESLQKLRVEKTYSASLYAMALDALARARQLSLPPDDRKKGALSRKERGRLQASIRWLLEAKWPNQGTWGYERWQNEKRAKWQDYSNTQFAVLALAVGAKHGIDIPNSVFEEVIVSFRDNSWPLGPPETLNSEGPGWWRDVAEIGGGGATGVAGPVTSTDAGFRLRGAPQAWGYRPGFGGQGSPGQYSMIAAATSCLIVAREGLGAKLKRNPRWDIDRLIAGGMISLHHGWNRLFPSPGDSIHRNYYYTLYSLEKALDLGGIVLLGDIDWYRQQAVLLINDQRQSGAWGRSDNGPEYQEVSTAFALLFLKRATLHLRVEEQGAILTGSGGSSGVDEGRVYVPSLRGTVDIAEAFESLEDLRTQQYLRLAREIVASIPPEQLLDLLPHFAKVRNGSRDAADRLATETIQSVTGLPVGVSTEALELWRQRIFQIRESGQSRDAAAVAQLIADLAAESSSDPMRMEVLRSLARIGSLDAVPGLIQAVAAGGPKVCRRAHDVLADLTAHRFGLGDKPNAEQRTNAASRWTGFWDTNGPRLIRFQTFDRLRRELDAATEGADRARLIEEIVALGDSILPRVDQVLANERFAFDWVVVRERLSGERVGVK